MIVYRPLVSTRGTDYDAPTNQNRDRNGAVLLPSHDSHGAVHYDVPTMSDPLAYLITIRTYGTWLHGDERGSVNREQNVYATPMLAPNPALERAEKAMLKRAPVAFSATQRSAVDEAVRKTCHELGWTLRALNVRTNHVHAVIAAPDDPERVMHALKSFATRQLRELGLVDHEARLWSRHGSTRYLWKPKQVEDACRYVVESQGDDMDGIP